MTHAKPAWTAAAAVATALCALLLSGAAHPANGGAYTHEQAANGQFVYIEYCLKCHGAHLEGGAGPPLQGPRRPASPQRSRAHRPADP